MAETETMLLDIKETAKILNISAQTIYQRLQPGSRRPFPARVIRIGRSIRFRKKDVLAMADGKPLPD